MRESGGPRGEEMGKDLLGMLLPRAGEDGEAPVQAGEGALVSSLFQAEPNWPSIRFRAHGPALPTSPTAEIRRRYFQLPLSSGKAPGFARERGKIAVSLSSGQAAALLASSIRKCSPLPALKQPLCIGP